MSIVNLDTHILIHALEGSLTDPELEVLTVNDWGVSAIVFWELAKLVQLGRVSLDLDDGEVIRALGDLHVWPIDLAVSRTSTRLDFRSDPADELIAATSIVHGAPLVTRDRVLRESRIVPLAHRDP